jgi:hypothetical protein
MASHDKQRWAHIFLPRILESVSFEELVWGLAYFNSSAKGKEKEDS